MIAIIVSPVGSVNAHSLQRRMETIRIKVRSRTMSESSFVSLDGDLPKIKLKVKFLNHVRPENVTIEIISRFEKKKTLLKNCRLANLTYSIDRTRIKLDRIATAFN